MPNRPRIASVRAAAGLAVALALCVAVLVVVWRWRVAREEGRARLCRDILARYGQAFGAYVADHDGWLPFEAVGREADGHLVWFDALAPYMTDAERVCPSVNRSTRNHEEGFRMNSQLAKSNALQVEGYRRLDSLDRPEATVVLFDAEYGGKKRSLKGKLEDVNFRHNGKANILLADWSVRPFTRSELSDFSRGLPPQIVWAPPATTPAEHTTAEGRQ